MFRVFRRVGLRAARWVAARTGYDVVRPDEVRSSSLPSHVVDDPRLAPYHRDRAGEDVRFDAPAERGMLEAFALGPRSAHPYAVATRAALASNSPRSAILEALEAYYSLVTPSSTAEWLDLQRETAPALASIPAVPAFLPWLVLPLDHHLQRLERIERAENAKHGLSEGGTAGWKAFGPMSKAKISIEADRLNHIVRSVNSHGMDHRRADYALFATVLTAGSEWRWLSRGGTHRAAIAAPLGVDPLPLRVGTIARREEVDIWPQVRSGMFTRTAALQVFDRLWDRRPPGCARRWLDWVDEQEQARPPDGLHPGGA